MKVLGEIKHSTCKIANTGEMVKLSKKKKKSKKSKKNKKYVSC
jgi:hypothetical protein